MKIRALVAAFAAAALTSLPASAQRSATERDAAELRAHRLTMDGIRKMAAAGEAMMKAMENDPRYKAEQALKQEIDALEKKDELTEAEEKRLEDLRTKLEEQDSKDDLNMSNVQTIDEMARRIESVPEMAKAIRSAGLTPREYSVLSLVTMQAFMVHGFQKAAGNKELPKDLADKVLEDNIKFIAANEAEITRLMQKMQPTGKKP